MKKTLVLLLAVVVCSICSHSLSFGQTPFQTPITVVNGTDKDSLWIGVEPTATYGIDSTTWGEKGAPPAPPAGVFFTCFRDPRYPGASPNWDQGILGKDIRHLTSNCQIDTFKIYTQPSTEGGTSVTYSWSATLGTLGCGRWRLTNSLNPALTTIDIDMLSQTSVTVGTDTVPNIYIRKSDGTQYRTFDMATLALDGLVDAKGKHTYGKEVKSTVNQVQFCITLTNLNPSATVVNDLHVEFSTPVDPATITVSHFTTTATDPKQKAGAYTKFTFTGATIDSAGTVTICGYGVKSGTKVQTLKSYFWTHNGTAIGKAISGKGMTFTQNDLRLPMPNTVNAGNQMFAQVYTPTKALLVIGVTNTTKGGPAFVNHAKYSDVLKSLVANPGKVGKQVMHDTLPTNFNNFDDAKKGLRAGKAMTGKQATLAPTKQRNSLFGQALTLAVNIQLSATEKIPAGLGQLMINIPSSPLNGKTVDSLLAYCNVFLSNGSVPGAPTLTAAALEALCANVNTAFNGMLDTIQWSGGKIKFTPVSALGDLGGWLVKVPGIEPRIIADLSGNYTNKPEEYSLAQNYPNPFNPTTTIQFTLGNPADVTVKVFNVIGQEVATLANHEQFGAGMNQLEFNASNMPSGVYFYRISVTDNASGQLTFQDVKKMVLLK